MSYKARNFVVEGNEIPSALKFYNYNKPDVRDRRLEVTHIHVDLEDKQGIVELRKFVAAINKQIAEDDTYEKIRSIVREEMSKNIREAIAREVRPGGMLF